MSKEFTPFKNIGLCFSGGGYRATFYSLGIISYLNQIKFKGKPILEAVSALSSVSGGTLLAVAYAKAAQQDNFDFDTFYSAFYNAFKLENDKLLKTAINKLTDDALWKANPHKTRSIINAFALTYSEMKIFKGDFSVFLNPTSSHLKHVCFNATDFSFGLSFRFQNGDGVFGNSPLENAHATALLPQLDLGDIIASSSCFPIGFEPMLFPDDYCKDHKNVDYLSLKTEDRFKDGVGIMDGGIADNQGINSMQLINNRNISEEKIGLFIINDVSSFKMEPWRQAKDSTIESATISHSVDNISTYFSIKPLYWIILLTGIILVFINKIHLINECSICTWSVFYSIGLVLIGAGLVLVGLGAFATSKKIKVKAKLDNFLRDNVPSPILNEVDSFKNLEIGVVQRMLTNRMTSSVKMINDVFLKQIRRLTYNNLYAIPALEFKNITTTVYSLNGRPTPYSGGKFKYNKAIKPVPSKPLKDVGYIASTAPTSLWWETEDVKVNRMDKLIACGQFTICYELIEYVLKLQRAAKENKIEINETDLKALSVLKETLLKDWRAFNEAPLFMV